MTLPVPWCTYKGHRWVGPFTVADLVGLNAHTVQGEIQHRLGWEVSEVTITEAYTRTKFAGRQVTAYSKRWHVVWLFGGPDAEAHARAFAYVWEEKLRSVPEDTGTRWEVTTKGRALI